MKEDGSEASSVWSKYVAAKKSALGDTGESDEPLTIEQLEAAIAQTAASSGLPEIGMPPRSDVHPGKRSRQLSRLFYLSLVVIFSGLVVGLVWWGREHYTGLNQ